MTKRIAIALLAASTLSSPAFAVVTIWDGAGATDEVTWGQLGGSFAPVNSNTTATSSDGATITVTSSTTLNLQRRDQGNGWAGNFAPGTALLWNQGSAGDITITFLSAVAAAGAQFQSNAFGAFVARVTTNDGSFFDVNGTSNSGANNSAVFVGARSDTASITSITFRKQSGPGGNDFAIGSLSLLGGSVSAAPEPGTWAMMIAGFGMAGTALRYRRRRTRVTFA